MINIPDSEIFNAIMQVQRSGKIDMFNLELSIWYFRSVKENKTADWIEANKSIYIQGLLAGFKNEVKEIKNITNKFGI